MYHNEELQHYGVKGMKWGVRKKREYASLNVKRAAYKSANKQAKANMTPEEQKAARRKTALKVGAAAAGTALAAYGAYKLTKAVKDKNFKIMEEKGRTMADEYLNATRTQGMSMFAGKNGTYEVHTTYRNGTSGVTTFKNKAGANEYWRMVDQRDRKHTDEASKIYKEYIDRGTNANLKESAKNVYDYYKRRGR